MPDKPPVPPSEHVRVIRNEQTLSQILAAAKKPASTPTVTPVVTHVPPEPPAA